MCLFLRFRTRFEEKKGFCRYRKLIVFGTALWVHEREICSRDFAEECLAFKFVLLEVFFRACSWNTNVIMVWAWMLRDPYALGTRTLLWFGHGCSETRMLLEHERYYGLGMDALRPVCSWKKSSRKPTAPRARLTNYIVSLPKLGFRV